MSFPLNFISGWNTSDHEPIQKTSSSRYLIKFWFSPDLRQIIEYQAIFYPQRFLFFAIPLGIQKQKQTPKSDWKNLYFSIEIDLAPWLERQSAPENGPLDAAQQITSYPHRPWHEESFSGPDTLTGTVWIES